MTIKIDEAVQAYTCINSFASGEERTKYTWANGYTQAAERSANNATAHLASNKKPPEITVEVQRCEGERAKPIGKSKMIVTVLLRGKYKTKTVDGVRVGFIK